MAKTITEPPFELIGQKPPVVSAEAGHVAVWIEVKSLSDQADTRNLKIILEGSQAATLGFELIENARKLR
jgi:hypothetical protein